MRNRNLSVLSLVVAIAAPGCFYSLQGTASLSGEAMVMDQPPQVVAAPTPPPPPAQPVAYARPVQPTEAAVWVDGYYDFRGGQWVWVDGRWDNPPRPGRVWQPPSYAGGQYYPGYWRDPNTPAPIGYATPVSSGGVAVPGAVGVATPVGPAQAQPPSYGVQGSGPAIGVATPVGPGRPATSYGGGQPSTPTVGVATPVGPATPNNPGIGVSTGGPSYGTATATPGGATVSTGTANGVATPVITAQPGTTSPVSMQPGNPGAATTVGVTPARTPGAVTIMQNDPRANAVGPGNPMVPNASVGAQPVGPGAVSIPTVRTPAAAASAPVVVTTPARPGGATVVTPAAANAMPGGTVNNTIRQLNCRTRNCPDVGTVQPRAVPVNPH